MEMEMVLELRNISQWIIYSVNGASSSAGGSKLQFPQTCPLFKFIHPFQIGYISISLETYIVLSGNSTHNYGFLFQMRWGCDHMRMRFHTQICTWVSYWKGSIHILWGCCPYGNYLPRNAANDAWMQSSQLMCMVWNTWCGCYQTT